MGCHGAAPVEVGDSINAGSEVRAGTAARQSPAERLGTLLENEELATKLERCAHVAPAAVTALAALAEQAVRMGIDYRTLGVGWHHPASRSVYRAAEHNSIAAPPSRQRATNSRQRLQAAAEASMVEGGKDAEAIVVELFVLEIGLQLEDPVASEASFAGVKAALDAELLLPLRALNECTISQAMNGAPLPAAALNRVVQSITGSVLSAPDGFSNWRYGNPVGQEQLRGLSDAQVALWREPTEMRHSCSLRTHEDDRGELGFFWATKIGGPSHGFDYESQCILPLLANARHKVLLVSDSRWPHHPVGRAHWRLLWAVVTEPSDTQEPRLWLETVNRDFEADVASEDWDDLCLRHAMEKARAMGVALSVEACLADDLRRLASAHVAGAVREVRESMVLRPSNALVEASDYLSSKHDWVQTEEEVTRPINRALFMPSP